MLNLSTQFVFMRKPRKTFVGKQYFSMIDVMDVMIVLGQLLKLCTFPEIQPAYCSSLKFGMDPDSTFISSKTAI